VYLIEPQDPCGTDPQHLAPELLNKEPFDGYAVDLWSAGVMLFSMLLGTDTLFAAPLPEDLKFKEICIRGNLKGALGRWQDKKAPPVSDDALDLLQGMLQAAPNDRLSADAVRAHPWVTAKDVAPLEKIMGIQISLEASR
jgi:serine/threonine protein kinase